MTKYEKHISPSFKHSALVQQLTLTPSVISAFYL